MIPPSRIGAYPVERLLGAGAMGSVFLARDPLSGEPVAIKVLHERDPELLARFAREASVMARIQDPRVVRALDSGLHEGQPFLVLEFCPGQDLSSLLKTEGAMAPDRAAALLAEIGRGLAAAHAVGALHRDLKPANVLVDLAGRPKLTDFGLTHASRGQHQGHSLTQSGVILGTPGYMAPEQMQDVRACDARSDIYALGVILSECLQGKSHFGTGNALAIMQRVLEGQSEPLPASLPRELVEVVECATALDPADRFNDALVFVAALEEFLAGARVSSPRPPGTWIAVGAALLVVVLLGGLAWSQAQGATSPTPAASLALVARPSHSPSPSPAPPSPRAPSPRVPASSAARRVPEVGSEDYRRDRLAFWRAPLAEIRSAAEAGHPSAMARLASCLLSGQGVPWSPQEGLNLAQRAAKLGDPDAMVTVAKYWLTRRPLAKESKRQGMTWLKKASSLGNSEAAVWLALRGNDPAQVSEAAARARADLAAGDPAAYYGLVKIARDRGDSDLAREACAGGCKIKLGHAFSLRARLNRIDGQAKDQLRDDLSRAAARHEVDGLCGLARWLLNQPAPTASERARAEALLSEAETMPNSGAEVERVLGHWRERDLEAWKGGLTSLLNGPAGALGTWHWGDLVVHLADALPSLPEDLVEFWKAAFAATVPRAAPLTSLDPRVSYNAGLGVYRGLGGKRAIAKSMPYLKRAAEAGHRQACHAWGVALCSGIGVAKNVPEGRVFLKRAGDLGHVESWIYLGDHFASLATSVQEKEGALAYFLKAAKDPRERPALYGRITVLYSTLERWREARKWGERSAKSGDPIGSAYLGAHLVEGMGGPVDLERGIQLLKVLADRDAFQDVELPAAIMATSALSKCFLSGLLGPPDPALAKHYQAKSLKLKQRVRELRER